MNKKYMKLTVAAMADLSIQKQLEVYGFAKSLKKNYIPKNVKKKKRLINLIGIGNSNTSDTSLNHDKYLYDHIC